MKNLILFTQLPECKLLNRLLFIWFMSLMLWPRLMDAQDTLVCDNGGFENDFQFYRGFAATYQNGSNDCKPLSNGLPVVWTGPLSLPAFRRFEIVSPGIDPLVNLQRTKFGNKAMLINNKYNHTSGICAGSRDVNKLTKRFKVTAATRDFTVWYAVALENPSGHVNSQPFISIKCDLAPDYEMCFDADLIQCDSIYNDPNCGPEKMDVLDWTCHRIKIDSSHIGQIATLEIMVADCGCSAHNGYAYIDGICESCDGSALGSGTLSEKNPPVNGIGINYQGCNEETARVCGSFNLPKICGTWSLDSLVVPGYTIYNVSIDNISKTFCFDFPITNFTGSNTCLEIFAKLYFKSGGFTLPAVTTNSINICKNKYLPPHKVEALVGLCNPNDVSDNNISDDYYNVSVSIDNTNGASWVIERKLDNPYPNESGFSIVTSGTGNTILNLGPYFIQEGSWKLTVRIGVCSYAFDIIPPSYCSGCQTFKGVKLWNVKCNSLGTTSVSDDTWSFDINVQGPNGQTYNITSGTTSTTCAFNNTCTIQAGVIGQTCKEYTLTYGALCTSRFTICPPKPCSNNAGCELEVNLKNIVCLAGGNYSIGFNASSTPGAYICYKLISTTTSNILQQNSLSTGSATATNLNQDAYLIVYQCPTPSCTCNPTCFKTIYIPKPDDCGTRESVTTRSSNDIDVGDLQVIPNPVSNNEMDIISNMDETYFEIYNASGNLVLKQQFSGEKMRLTFDNPAGMYIIRYRNNAGKFAFKKVIKL